jgi:hypothetical protein
VLADAKDVAEAEKVGIMRTAVHPNQILRRDRIVRGLRRLVARNPAPAMSAMTRIASEIVGYMEQKLADRRTRAFMRLKLLEIAKRVLLHPEEMDSRSGVGIDPERCPPGVEPAIAVHLGNMKKWQAEAYRALGYYGLEVDLELWNQVGHLKSARDAGFDVCGRHAIDAYAFAVSHVLSRGKQSITSALADLDPSKVSCPFATPVMALDEFLRMEMRAPLDEERDENNWWRLAILLLLGIDPTFDGSGVGLAQPLSWDGHVSDDICSDRKRILESCRMYWPRSEDLSADEHLLVMLQRTHEHLDEAVRERRNKPTPTLHDPLPHLEEEGEKLAKRVMPNPDAQRLRDRLGRLRDMSETETLSPTEVMDIYGIASIDERDFLRSPQFVARSASPKAYQLPRPVGSGQKGAKGRYESQAAWRPLVVLEAAKGWLSRLGEDTTGLF